MLEIVKQASLAMKLSAGVLAMQMGPADLAAIVREGVGAAGLGDDRRVDLELDDVTVECDHTRLVEVVRQVVQNAGTYSPPGEPIAVSLTGGGTDAVLTVVDHGPGIPEDRREHVFTTFPNWRPAGYRGGAGDGPRPVHLQGPGCRTRRRDIRRGRAGRRYDAPYPASSDPVTLGGTTWARATPSRC